MKAGTTLGRYLLTERVGAGGMSEVFRATDSTLHRSVAVKVILDPIAEDKVFAERFLREARLVAGLEHANILPIYDFGTAEIEGRTVSFLVMPLVTGGSLKEQIRGPVAYGQAIAWLSGIAAALDHAHGKGILHRDIKPGNVLLDSSGRPLLADFGLARMAESVSQLTATGTVMGTPAYMAPEQAMGEKIDARADQYALAVIAFELLTGRVPFKADSPLAILHLHVSRPPEPISQVLPRIPPGVDAVMTRALAKAPDQRYRTCTEFVTALGVALGVSAPPGTVTEIVSPMATVPVPPPPGRAIPPPPAGPASQAMTVVSGPSPSPAPPVTPPPPPAQQAPPLAAPASAGALGQKRSLVLPIAIGVLVVLFLATVAIVAVLGKRKMDSLTSTLPPAEPTVPVEATPLPEPTPAPSETAIASVPPMPTAVEGVPEPMATAIALAMMATPVPGQPGTQVEISRPSGSSSSGTTRPSGSGTSGRSDPKHVASAPEVTLNDLGSGFPQEATVGGDVGIDDTGLASILDSLDATRKPERRLEKSDFASALGEARRLKQRSPSQTVDFIDTYSRAGIAFADGRDQEAWTLLRRALPMAPENVLSSRRIYFVDALVNARGNMPGSDGAWIMGLAFDDVRGDLEEELDKALERSPNSGPVWYGKGIHAFRLGHNRQGWQAFKKACDAGVQGACNAMRSRGKGR